MKKYIVILLMVLPISQTVFSQTFSLVKDIWPGNGAGVSISAELVPWNNKVYFTGRNGASANGNELYVSDGTDPGTYMVKDLNPGTGAGGAFVLSLLNNQLVFFGGEPVVAGNELYKSDGTDPGTVLVKDINPGMAGSIGYTQATLNGYKYFDANNATYGNELWRTDGTAAGTILIKDINPAVGESGNPREIRMVGNLLFFYADDGINGQEVWRSDGTEAGTAMVKDIVPGSGGVQDGIEFADFNGVAYFRKNDGVKGTELWRSDGTEAGTYMVKDINSGTGSSDAFNFIVFNNHLYFIATDAVSQKLWKTDGTATGTVSLANAGGTYSVYGNNPSLTMAVCNGFLFFPGIDAATGLELWKTDGTIAGTTMVKDINAGTASTDFRNFITVNNKIVFDATTAAAGSEPWVSDGTNGGTYMLQDVEPGTGSSRAGPYIIAGTKLFSVRTTVANGRELWVADNFVTLPLNLLSFSAQKCGSINICLTWKTANEQNVSNFEIERSIDGRVFSRIGTISANNQATNNYSVTDNSIPSSVIPVVYYCLKQKDMDGKFSYSAVIPVKLVDKPAISTYPNPATDILNVIGWNNVKQMWLYDMSGRKLNEWQTVQPSVSVKNLSGGSYILQAELRSGEIVTQKLIIMK